jgi:hypothetical protein
LKNTRHALYGTLNPWKIQGIDVIDKNGALQSPLAPFVEWVSLMYVAASECGEKQSQLQHEKHARAMCHIATYISSYGFFSKQPSNVAMPKPFMWCVRVHLCVTILVVVAM